MKKLFVFFSIAMSISFCTIDEEAIDDKIANDTDEEIFISLDYDNAVISSFRSPLKVSIYTIPAMSSFSYSVIKESFNGTISLVLVVVKKM